MGYLDGWLSYRCAGLSKGRMRRASCVLVDGMAGSGDHGLHDFNFCSPGIPFQRWAASSGPKGLVSHIRRDSFGLQSLLNELFAHHLRQSSRWTSVAARMPILMRVEFSKGLRPDSPRFVLMVEIPDSAAAELTAKKVTLETRAYEVAFETTHADRSDKPDYQMNLMSCTRGKVKNLESLGEPSLLATDACRAWVIKRPSPLQELLDKGWQSRQKNPGSKA